LLRGFKYRATGKEKLLSLGVYPSANWAATHSSKVIRRLEMDVFSLAR